MLKYEERKLPTMKEEENLGIDVKAYYDRFGALVFRRCIKLLQDEEKALDAYDMIIKIAPDTPAAEKAAKDAARLNK